jgi:hypothetical protein
MTGPKPEDEGLSVAAPDEMPADSEHCRLCGAWVTIELYGGYWLCRPCCDRLGSEAMKQS